MPYRLSCALIQGQRSFKIASRWDRPGSQIPIAERGAPPDYVPLPAVSSLGGLRTPAAVRVETFVTASVRKPSQNKNGSFELLLR